MKNVEMREAEAKAEEMGEAAEEMGEANMEMEMVKAEMVKAEMEKEMVNVGQVEVEMADSDFVKMTKLAQTLDQTILVNDDQPLGCALVRHL